MSRMVPRSVSIADLPFMEVGTADAFLRFEVAMTDILPRRAGFGGGDVLLPFIQTNLPQRLKPGSFFVDRCGTSELVPFPVFTRC